MRDTAVVSEPGMLERRRARQRQGEQIWRPEPHDAEAERAYVRRREVEQNQPLAPIGEGVEQRAYLLVRACAAVGGEVEGRASLAGRQLLGDHGLVRVNGVMCDVRIEVVDRVRVG